MLDGTKDWEWIAEMWCYGLWGFGLRPTDIVLFAFSYGTFIGFWGAHYACEKIGCLVLSSGSATTESRVKSIIDMGVTTVCSTPTYALRMWQAAAEMGIDLARDSKVDKVIVSGEPAGSIPAVKRQIEAAWGAKVGDTAGMTEIGTIMIFECAPQPGGTHIIEDHFIEEVLEYEGDRPVPYGERAERVVTSFGRGFIPLIRYRTNDLVVKVPHTPAAAAAPATLPGRHPGPLGRHEAGARHQRLSARRRIDRPRVRRGRRVPDPADPRRRDRRDQVLVELKPGREDHWDPLRQRLHVDLADAHEGLRFNVERAPPNSLPRFELKAKRLVDKRPVAEYSG